MDLEELSDLIERLRAEGSDVAQVEVKSAAGGYPRTHMPPTLSAFGNRPGGGLVVLGLDEDAGFSAVGVGDAAACKAALASQARQAVRPPLTLSELTTMTFEGVAIILATVDELPTSNKPCRVIKGGNAYLRSHDGDYQLSEQEDQAFLANRGTPTFDQRRIDGTTARDLEADLTSSYVTACRTGSPSLEALDDAEVMFRTGVTVAGSSPDDERSLTVAGLLALGTYPQHHLPNCVIQASVAPRATDPSGTRATDVRRFDGPVPTMLDEALRWVRRNTRTRVRFGADGQGRDEPEFPAEAVRELLSNALIHRDLGPHALTTAITLKLDDRQLVLSNPGGLWGVSVERLGSVGVTSARNGWLLRICQNISTREGNRVVEALATGIPTVLTTLREAGMAPPGFEDQGIRFSVRVPNHSLLAREDLQWLSDVTRHSPLSDQQRQALVAMRHGTTWTDKSFRDMFPMDSREAARALAALVDAGVAVAHGERRARTYRLSPRLRARTAAAPREAGRAASPPPTHGLSSGSGEAARGGELTRARNTIVRESLRRGASSVLELTRATGLTSAQVSYALRILREAGDVVLNGGRGRSDSRYELVADRPGEASGGAEG